MFYKVVGKGAFSKEGLSIFLLNEGGEKFDEILLKELDKNGRLIVGKYRILKVK